jgi:hypothetical protein
MNKIELAYSHNQYMQIVQKEKEKITRQIYSVKRVFDKIEN